MAQGIKWSNHGTLVATRTAGASEDFLATDVNSTSSGMDPTDSRGASFNL